MSMNKNLKLKLIVAMCKNNGIGMNNKIPWKISEDMVYFSNKTIGKYTSSDDDKKNAVIMGRNTWESLPKKYKPLPNRLNVVLTRSRNVDKYNDNKYNDNTNEVRFVSCVDDVMDLCHQGDERLEKGEKGEKGEKKSKIYSYALNDIWIIGGSSVYQEFIKRDIGISNNNNNNTCISKYYITYIDKDYNCDTYFPLLENMSKYYLAHFKKHKCIDSNTPNDAPLHVYYIVFKKIDDYVDEKIIQTLFTPHKSKNENKSNLTLYIKKTDDHEYGREYDRKHDCNDGYENKNDKDYDYDYDYEILFSMFCS